MGQVARIECGCFLRSGGLLGQVEGEDSGKLGKRVSGKAKTGRKDGKDGKVSG
jgi:hypothetical protein